MKELINKKFPAGSFIRNSATLMTGTTLSQLILVFAAPILTRLYTPEIFGVFTLYTSILGLLSVVVCLRYELTIVLPEDDKDAGNILFLSIILCIFISFVILILVFFFRNEFSVLLGASEFEFVLWFLPLSLLLTGLFQSFNYWSTRKKQFKRLALRQITQNSVTAFTQISNGTIFQKSGPMGMITGYIAGQTIATVRLAFHIWKDEGKYLFSIFSIQRIKKMFFRYINFFIYGTGASFINVASSMIPPVLLGYYFSSEIVGFYGLSYRVLLIPMGVMGAALSQVFFPRAVKAKGDGELGKITFRIFKELFSLSFVPFVLLAIAAPELFRIIFGDKWQSAGEFTRYMSLWTFIQFISVPLSSIYLVLEKQRLLLVFNILLFITRLFSLIIGGLSDDPLLTIKLFAFSSIITYCYFCFQILYLAKVMLLQVFKFIFSEILKASPFIILPLLILIFFNETAVTVFSAIAIGVLFAAYKGYAFKDKLWN